MSSLKGLLFAWCWYNSARLKAVDSQKPTFLVYCDMTTPEVSSSPEYNALYDVIPPLEKDVVPRLELLHRRIYSTVADTHDPSVPYPSFPTKYVTLTMLNVTQDGAEKLAAWYEKELLPSVKKVPGWARSRRYDLVTNDDWAGSFGKDYTLPYMIVHESHENNVPNFESIAPPLPGVVDIYERRLEVVTVFEQPDGKPQGR